MLGIIALSMHTECINKGTNNDIQYPILDMGNLPSLLTKANDFAAFISEQDGISSTTFTVASKRVSIPLSTDSVASLIPPSHRNFLIIDRKQKLAQKPDPPLAERKRNLEKKGLIFLLNFPSSYVSLLVLVLVLFNFHFPLLLLLLLLLLLFFF